MRQEFIDAVNSKDYDLVKIMLCNSLLVDPSGSNFDSMFNYAKKNLSGLVESFDGGVLNNDTSYWNKDYLDEQLLKLEDNFSLERIEFVKLLCATILNNKMLKIDEEKRREKYKDGINKQQVGSVVATAGVITTVAGVVLSKPIIVGIGVTAIVIGGVLYYIDRR